MGLALGLNMKFYTSVAKVLKLKVRKFWGLVSMFVEVTGEKLGGGSPFYLPPILNRVKEIVFSELALKCKNNIIKLGKSLKKQYEKKNTKNKIFAKNPRGQEKHH